MMRRIVLCVLIMTALCFGQNIQSEVGLSTHEDSFDKSISLEAFIGVHLTLGHSMGWVYLPDYMLLGGLQVGYQPSQRIVLSCAGSYSHASNLDFIWNSFLTRPVRNFTYMYVDVQVAYTNKIAGNFSYLIGAGLDISCLKGFEDDTTSGNADITNSSTYLRPLVSGGLRFNISRSLYSHIQTKYSFYHLLETGYEHIYLADISPSVSLGIGYMLIR